VDLSYQSLKARQRAVRDSHSKAFGLRTHRALSWLQRAEQEAGDPDARFIFLWIAFNAAYANNLGDRQSFSERRLLLDFVQKLIECDKAHLLYQAVWDEFPKSIRLLLTNKYVYQPFWDSLSGDLPPGLWEERFRHDSQAAQRSLGRMDTKKVLAILFERLYVLRNQLVHGGATWNSSTNRKQMRDGANIMARLVPIIIHVMLENGHESWGEPFYPVVEG
jgi:hypothetical protein